MMINRTLLIVFLVSVSAVLGLGQTSDYWLIKESKGTWQYRIGNGEHRQLTGKYDCLVPAGELRCMDKNVRLCELRYLVDPRSDKTERLPLKPLQTGRWISLRNLKPPDPPILSATPKDLVPKFKRTTQVGGSRGGSVCGGNLALKAPACGDTVDVTDFRIRWTATGEDNTKKVSILVERVDGEPSLFRSTAPASKGEYADDKLLEFLRRTQGRNDIVDIAVRIMAESGRYAVRLVHIPSFAQWEQYQLGVRKIASPDPFVRSVQLMSLALDAGMWSRAAEEASRLIELTPGAPELQEYALAGLCQSDFVEEKTKLRSELPKERYESICAPTGAPREGAVAEMPQVAQLAEMAKPRQLAATRLGLALLIGNSDYWNMPLNSVKNDVRSMREALEKLGFHVTVQENLKNPMEFQEALDEVEKKGNAGPEDILLVYYSGHGLQLDGKAHFLGTGVSATARVAEDVRSNSQSAERLLADMERAVPGTRILIVEACRNNVLTAPSDLGGQSPRGGFAFQQDDVPNTFVMFANRPGLPTPVRSDYGLMGPFTESLIYALQYSSGEIQEVFALAAKKTKEISPGQEPVLYTSKRRDPIAIRQQDRKLQFNRSAQLLNAAADLYRDQAWDQFLVTVNRARALALDPGLERRLNREVEFGRLVMSAEKEEENHRWKEAAENWQRSSEIFPVRPWLTMKTAIAWLMADDLRKAVKSFALLSAQSEGQLVLQARDIMSELFKIFPDLEADARKKERETPKVSGQEFELVEVKE